MKTVVRQPLIAVSGMAVRTNNHTEMQPEGGKLAALWQRFYQDFAAQLAHARGVYGVYSDYASDEHGDFTVTAALAGVVLEGENIVDLHLPAGNYLVFSRQGEMPQAVIDCWQDVWAYFAAADCPHTRRFSTDYEHYDSDNRINIYIAVDEPTENVCE